MNLFKSLLVIWKDKKNNLYYHVGTLLYDGEKYTFTYTFKSNSHRKIEEALANGYRPHPAFPDLKKEYTSTGLFLAFDRRIPSNDRVDYTDILKDLDLPMDADRMDVLRKTRGMLSGDAYSFEEPLSLNHENHLETNFYINGMRHQGLDKEWPSSLQIGEQLIAIHEEDNKIDCYAVRIETTDGLRLGYIPGIYAQAVAALIRHRVKITLTIYDIRPSLAPQWWVRVGLYADLNMQKLNINNDKELEGLILSIA